MIKWERIFDEINNIDYEETLQSVRSAIIKERWTDVLEDIFDSMLREQEGHENFAQRIDITIRQARKMYDHGYRTLKQMAEKGKIKPVFKGQNDD